MTTLHLAVVRPWGGPSQDVIIEAGRITAVVAAGSPAAAGAAVVQGRGRLLLPSFSDVHVHLQDYNELVLRLVTIPNIILVWCKYDWNIPTIYLPRLLHLV